MSITYLTEALGKIIFEVVLFSLGVALVRSLLSGDSEVDLGTLTVRVASYQEP